MYSFQVICAIVVGSGFCMAQSTGVGAIKTDFAYPQKDAPVQVIGVMLDLDSGDLCQAVTIINTSSKAVQKVQIGWTVSESKAAAEKLAIAAYGPISSVAVNPGQVTKIGPEGATLDSVTKAAGTLNLPHAALVVGVVYVEFADGTEWYYPLKDKKHFVEKNDPGLLQKIAPKINDFKSSAGVAADQSGSSSCPAPQGQQQLASSANSGVIPYTWWAVCNPLVLRHCNHPTPRTCGTELCSDPGVCDSQQCCVLDPNTGQQICY